MDSDRTVLIIDADEADRTMIANALAGRAGSILSVATPSEAFEIVQDLDSISLLVAAFTTENGNEIFDFRDHIVTRFGDTPGVFCSSEDMTPFYGRVRRNERLFFKPVDTGIFLEWFDQHVVNNGNTAGQEESANRIMGGQTPQPAIDDRTQPITPPVQGGYGEEGNADPNPVPEPQTTSSPVELPEDALPVGTRLGDYKLLRIIQEDRDFALYEAEQTSIGRKVALKILFRKHRRDINWVQAFVDEASARASVNHSNISLVYDCDQEMGVNFYTLELVDAPSLSDLARRRAPLEDRVLWGVLDSVASALVYLRESGMRHRLVSAQTILLLSGEHCRIANPVKGRGEPLSVAEENQQMRYLADALIPFLSKGSTDPALISLVDRLGADRIDAVKTIDGLVKALGTSDPKEHLSDAEIAKIEARAKNRAAIVGGGIIGAIILLGGIITLFLLGGKPEVRELDTMSKIPEGAFPYQDGEPLEVAEFWIGQYEVTISDYAEFLDDIALNPGKQAAIRHPDQPAEKTSYEPERWEEMLDAAVKGRKFAGARIDPNCPVIGVDWWDAQAYARWKGGRLPTEQEWEKAGRSRSGNVYPWGNEWDPSKANTGLDQNSEGDVKAGSIDGFRYWSPVDELLSDESRYGVRGLAGNVSEWTNTYDIDPDSPDKKVPIKRGASFANRDGFELTTRRAADGPGERNFWTGFRIASDQENLRPVREGDAPVKAPAEPEKGNGKKSKQEKAEPKEPEAKGSEDSNMEKGAEDSAGEKGTGEPVSDQ